MPALGIYVIPMLITASFTQRRLQLTFIYDLSSILIWWSLRWFWSFNSEGGGSFKGRLHFVLRSFSHWWPEDSLSDSVVTFHHFFYGESERRGKKSGGYVDFSHGFNAIERGGRRRRRHHHHRRSSFVCSFKLPTLPPPPLPPLQTTPRQQ